MSCGECEGCIACGRPSEEETAEIVKAAFETEPEDGSLLTGREAQMFARRYVNDLLKPLGVDLWPDTP